MGFLEKINSPEDIRGLDENELSELCAQLRVFLTDNVSKTGGHLAANLGVVELTVAIHRMFDTSVDRLVFDVGHQSYVHKILTGRREKFDTMRQFGGIAGFPKPSESIHDAFIAGHASSSISVALGMARARTLTGGDYSVLALLGDGALTGGLAYEGLCDAGASREPLIVILNDNGMSITKNVGGMARYLSRERIKPGYIAVKNFYRKATNAIPGGKVIYRFTHKIKQAIKKAILHCSMFEDMGFTYLGPVDGHSIKRLSDVLALAKETRGPVLVHVITKKGKGVEYAEQNPGEYHGVSAFDPDTGETHRSGESFSSVFGEQLVRIAEKDEKVVAITASMRSGTGLDNFAKQFPNRFFDVGIAEGHATSMAAGAAKQGLKPVLAVYSTFLQRAYDMIMQDIAICGERVVLAVDRSGLVGEDGETHHGNFDVSYLSSVPGMTIMSPASFQEMRDMLDFAVKVAAGPVAVRYPRGKEGRYTGGTVASSKKLREGTDFTIVTYGTSVNAALDAADLLGTLNISVEIIKLDFIKPLDFNAVTNSVIKTGRLMVLEECVSQGCVGERIAAYLTEIGQSPRRLILRNLGDKFITHGSVDVLYRECGIDAVSVAKDIAEALPRKAKES